MNAEQTTYLQYFRRTLFGGLFVLFVFMVSVDVSKANDESVQVTDLTENIKSATPVSSPIVNLYAINTDLFAAVDKQAIALLQNNELFAARQLINQAIDNTDFSQSPRLLINRLIIRASIDQQVGANISALQDLQFAFRLAASTNQQDMLGDIAFTIARIHQERNEHSIALSYAQQALRNYQQEAKPEQQAQCLLLMASSFLATQQLDSAQQHLNQVRPLVEESRDLTMQADYFQYIGELDLLNEEIASSIDTFSTALKLVSDENYTKLATLHLLLSRAQTEADNMDLAIDHLVKAFSFAENAQDAFFLNQALQLHRANLLGQLNEFEAAFRVTQDVLEDRNLHQPISDIKRMLDMHANFQLELQQQENISLKQDNEWQAAQIENKRMLDNLYWLIIGLLVSISCLLLLMFLRSKRHRSNLEKIANTDALTGLYSRSRVLDLLSHHQDLFSRSEQAYCAAIVDLDHFKKVNDNHGHLTGDKVLKQFGETCLTSFRKSDVIGRIGGEEFLIILPNTNIEKAQDVFIQLNQKLPKIGESLNLSIATTSSIGLVTPEKDEEPMNVVKRADQALYIAKEQGRNRVVIGNNLSSLQSSQAKVN